MYLSTYLIREFCVQTSSQAQKQKKLKERECTSQGTRNWEEETRRRTRSGRRGRRWIGWEGEEEGRWLGERGRGRWEKKKRKGGFFTLLACDTGTTALSTYVGKGEAKQWLICHGDAPGKITSGWSQFF